MAQATAPDYSSKASVTLDPPQVDLVASASPLSPPIVIIGNGPVGIRAAREIRARLPAAPLLVYGQEPYRPYDRVKLSHWLSGDLAIDELHERQGLPDDDNTGERSGYRVTRIDLANHTVHDQSGVVQAYSKLIIATGSRPFIPVISGTSLPGVYTFRDLDDANKLIARRASSRHTVILGGGLLGLEAARGMQRHHTQVTIVEHADRLMARQLDEEASATLQRQIESFGINVVLGDGAAQITGDERVTGIQLRSGQLMACDTVIISTGIQPNIQLAMDARIALGRGIRVDDNMLTSVADIYAVGECAEHRGRVYGLVAPGFEQAAVAAAHIAAGLSEQPAGSYPGSIAASRLKVVDTNVFSMGPMGIDARRGYGSTHVFKGEAGVYRKILIHRHRIEGAIGIGAWNDTLRLQGAIARKQRVWPWQTLRFLRTGSLWPAEQLDDIAQWPASAVVCQCTGVTRGQIGSAMLRGARTVQQIGKATGASTVCGSCKPLVDELLGEKQVKPVAGHRLLLGSGVLTIVAALAFFLLPSVPYPDTVQVSWRWDELWRDILFKQISGFTILGLTVAGLVLSPRKRIRKLQKQGRFDSWRLLHIALGVLVIAGLFIHTGMRLGSGLNFMLMASFTGLLLLGGLATGVIASEHKLTRSLARRLRKQSIWGHILLFWPVPVLLGFHILKGYWY